MDPEEIATNIVYAAARVHRALGPGLLESAYQQCFTYELNQRGLQVECEVALPLIYEEIQVNSGYRTDVVVEKSVGTLI
jgi:GxxExxY protein